MISMGTSEWLFDHIVDGSHLLQMLGSDAESSGRLFGIIVTFPQDAGTALRTDHRIIGMLQDGHPVTDTNAQGAAGAAFPITTQMIGVFNCDIANML